MRRPCPTGGAVVSWKNKIGKLVPHACDVLEMPFEFLRTTNPVSVNDMQLLWTADERAKLLFNVVINSTNSSLLIR
jgi:hypothetical protein